MRQKRFGQKVINWQRPGARRDLRERLLLSASEQDQATPVADDAEELSRFSCDCTPLSVWDGHPALWSALARRGRRAGTETLKAMAPQRSAPDLERFVSHFCLATSTAYEKCNFVPLPRTAEEEDAITLLEPWLAELAAPKFEANRTLDEADIRVPARESIETLSQFWIRDPDTFDSRASDRLGDPDELRRSLVQHLFVIYPVPPVLYGVWSEEEIGPFHFLFLLLAQGGSMRQWSAMFPDYSCIFGSRRTHLDQVPAELGLDDGLDLAAVLHHGGTPEAASALRRCGRSLYARFGRSPVLDFQLTCVHWLSAHGGGLTEDQRVRVLGWAHHEWWERREEGRGFSWRGRTVQSVLRSLEAYERQLEVDAAEERAATRRRSEVAPPPVAWAARGWDRELRTGDVVWSFRELTTAAALKTESRRMKHCVSGYASRCSRGDCAVFSLTRDGKPALTIEIRVPGVTLAQAAGSHNRPPTPEEMGVVRQWSREIGATLD